MKIILFLIISVITLGDVFRPLTILMDFPDYSYRSLHLREEELINKRKGEEFNPALYSEMFFAEESYTAYNGEPLISARSFFQMESGGTFSLEGDARDIYGWYTASKPAEHYGRNIHGKGDRQGAADLVREAIDKLVEKKVDFSRYDLNGDGIIDGIIIVYAGRGEQFKNSLGNKAIWPHYNTFSDISRGPFAYFTDHQGRKWIVNKFSLIPQDIPLDLYIHEIGHFLGLSDLYGKSSTVGFWSSMAYLYCGEIPGSKLNSFGGYHRNNLQNIYNMKNIQTFWAQTKEYELKDLRGESLFVTLHSSRNKKNDNLIKIKLPGKRPTIPIKPKKTYYSDNFFNRGSSFTFTTHLPRHTDNLLKLEAWFNSSLDRRNARLYIKPIIGDNWVLLESKNRKGELSYGERRQWLSFEYDLNKYSGHTVEIKGVLLPSIKEWRKGVYVSDIRVTADAKKIFDLKIDKNKIIFDGFSEARGDEELERYLLIEYRQPVDREIDEGLLHTPNKLPYPGGIIVWYINEDYTLPETLVSILPVNTTPVYEVIKGKMKEINDNKYKPSAWIITSKDIPEAAVEKDGRYFYRPPIMGRSTFEIIDGLYLEILEETHAKVLLNLSYGDD